MERTLALRACALVVLPAAMLHGDAVADSCRKLAASRVRPDLFDMARCGFYSEDWLAADLEEFAASYPKDSRSAVALSEAYDVRMELGEFALAREDAAVFAKLWGTRRPVTAAQLMFGLGEVYERQGASDMEAELLREYLAAWGNKVGAELATIAHFKLGEILWKQSCPRDSFHGACVEVDQPYERRARAQGSRDGVVLAGRRRQLVSPVFSCGLRTSLAFKVVARDTRLTREARQHFGEAVRLYATLAAGLASGAASFSSEAAFAAAGCAFYLAEPTYERFLGIPSPRHLDFSKATSFDRPAIATQRKRRAVDSERRFSAFLSKKAALAAALGKGRPGGLYHRVISYDVPHWTVAALARIGQLSARLVDQLYSVEIPNDLREMDEWGNRPREVFCDVWVDRAMPLEGTAVHDYERCLNASRRLSSWNEWSELCEAELNRMAPSEHPALVESVPEPSFSMFPSAPPGIETECRTCL
jgi:hypothetical protein